MKIFKEQCDSSKIVITNACMYICFERVIQICRLEVLACRMHVIEDKDEIWKRLAWRNYVAIIGVYKIIDFFYRHQ